MADFYAAVEKTLRFEGGYSNDPNDPAGPTKYGITLAALQSVSNHPVTEEDVKAMSIETAKDIYKALYWIGDDIQSQGIAEKHFDMGVNMGVITASKLLQTACNQFDFSLVVDGKIGAKSMSAINSINPSDLMTALCQLQEDRYWEIIISEITKKGTSWGWPANYISDALDICYSKSVDDARQFIAVLKQDGLKIGKLSFIPGWSKRANDRFDL